MLPASSMGSSLATFKTSTERYREHQLSSMSKRSALTLSMADPYPKLSLVDKGPILQVCNVTVNRSQKCVNSAQPPSHQLKEMIGKLKNWPDFFHYCSFSVRQLIFWFSFCLCLARLVLLLWHFYWSRWCWWFFLHLVNVLKKKQEVHDQQIAFFWHGWSLLPPSGCYPKHTEPPEKSFILWSPWSPIAHRAQADSHSACTTESV